MTEFLRLNIQMHAYRSIADAVEFFSSIGNDIEDAVTGQRGDWDWCDIVHSFFDEVSNIWRTMVEQEEQGGITLNHESPDEFLARITAKQVDSMDLVGVLTVLRKATFEKPEITEHNWNCSGYEGRMRDSERDKRFIATYQNGLVIAALLRLNALLQVTPADIKATLSLKPIFDSLSIDQFRTWNGWEPWEIEPGVQVLHVPYPDYHPVVIQWNETVYCTPFSIDPYREVPGKEGGVPPPRFMGLGERNRPTPEEFFADADLDEVRQYMSLCLHGEKWCDGHIAGEFERGVIQAAFQRLETIFDSASDRL